MGEFCWYPKSAEELKKCNSLYNAIAPEFDPKHPGFKDEAYKARRNEVVAQSASYEIGGEIPLIEYTEVESELWRMVYGGLRQLHPTFACKQYNAGIQLLEDAGLMRTDRVPQVAHLSDFLKTQTGFQLRPIGGFVAPRDFLAHLAYRYFPTTQYIRHPKNIDYSPDPDGIHDMVGHLPMFLNQEMADLTQKIGQISLGASNDMIRQLTSLYWFTVEVGLTRENKKMRVYGAAILSSCSEMEFALGNRVPVSEFDAVRVSRTQFDPTNYQQIYFVVDSISNALDQLTKFGVSSSDDF